MFTKMKKAKIHVNYVKMVNVLKLGVPFALLNVRARVDHTQIRMADALIARSENNVMVVQIKLVHVLVLNQVTRLPPENATIAR